MQKNPIDVLIEMSAETRSDADYDKLFDALESCDVFFNLNNGETPTVPMVDVGEGMKAVVFYTSSEDSRLTDRYGGISWKKGLQMASKMKGVDGIVIQGSSDSWVAISQSTISNLID